MTATAERSVVRCNACELRQYAQEFCRRCKTHLPAPQPVYQYKFARVERIVERVIQRIFVPAPIRSAPIRDAVIDDPALGSVHFGAVLPTMQQAEDSLIAEALRRAGDVTEAAGLIGIGKTTMYRRLHLLSGRAEGSSGPLIPPHMPMQTDPALLMDDDTLAGTSVEGLAE